MRVSRRKLKKACVEATERANLIDMRRTADRIQNAIELTFLYVSGFINPLHRAELPYFIAVLETALAHLKSIDENATDVAADLREAFGMKCAHIGSEALEEAMRRMRR